MRAIGLFISVFAHVFYAEIAWHCIQMWQWVLLVVYMNPFKHSFQSSNKHNLISVYYIQTKRIILPSYSELIVMDGKV